MCIIIVLKLVWVFPSHRPWITPGVYIFLVALGRRNLLCFVRRKIIPFRPEARSAGHCRHRCGHYLYWHFLPLSSCVVAPCISSGLDNFFGHHSTGAVKRASEFLWHSMALRTRQGLFPNREIHNSVFFLRQDSVGTFVIPMSEKKYNSKKPSKTNNKQTKTWWLWVF